MTQTYNIRMKSNYILVAEVNVPYPHVVIIPRNDITEKTIRFLLGVEKRNTKFTFDREDYQVNFNTELFLLLRNVYETL